MQPSRRTLLQIAGFLFPPLVVNPFGLFRSLWAPEGELRPLKRPRENPFQREGKTLVSVVHGRDVDQMVRSSVEMIGGLDRIPVRGRTVLVKPNVVSGDPPPATTSPEVVRSVVRMFREAGAEKVWVGDMSGLSRLPTRRNMEKTGISRAAREEGGIPIDFDDGDWIEVKPPQVRTVRSIHVARAVYEADILVNLPVLKTHRNATYSLCLKNLVGVTHPRYRPYRVSPGQWEKVVVEMNLSAHPDLNIVDATTSMIQGGPWEGIARETRLILASGDRIAADVAGLGLLKSFGQWEPVTRIPVWEQQQIRVAQSLGLGVRDRQSVQLLTKFLEGDAQEFSGLMEQVRELIQAGSE